MPTTITYLNDRFQVPLARLDRPPGPLQLVVPYTTPALTADALSAAADLALGMEASVTLLAAHVLPYPSPLECQDGIRHRLEAGLATIARTTTAAIRVKLVFARDLTDAYLGLLPRHSIVVIGARSRFWKTREERLARRLSLEGHSVALVKVK